MKTLHQNTFKFCSLAALNAKHYQTTGQQSVALLAAEIKQDDSGLVQLLPAGSFNAVDGRPTDVASGKWLLDEQAFQLLKANTPHQMGDLVIDYEHQTLKADKNGQPAPAAGFFHIDDVVFKPGEGLFIKPRWNKDGQAALDGGHYRYISAVFGYDRETGRPNFLHSAGLVNRPGVDGMQPLADLAANYILPTQQEDSAVNELLLAILKALGIKLDGDIPTDTTALSALGNQINTALAALTSDAEKVDGLNQQIVALQAKVGNPDPTKFVPVAALQAMQSQLAALQAGEVEELVEQGLKDGKLLPATKGWATDLGNKDLAQLKAFLDSAPGIAALKGNQTNGDDPNKHEQEKDDVAALSAEEKLAADNLGISHKDFAEFKQADQE